MITVMIDRNRISRHLKATVTVNSDVQITAYEARATKIGSPYGKGIGYDLLADDISAVNGVVSTESPVNSFEFDIESAELSADGGYRISVYVKDTNDAWNDCCQLYTASGEAVIDSTGKNVLVKRSGNGTDTSYKSAFTGDNFDDFIAEVLYV